MHTKKVSIHAPTRGATKYERHAIRVLTVSIHAPTRGATRRPRLRRPPQRSFNPRAHAGRDRCRRGRAEMVCFNPRAHAGRDNITQLVCRYCAFQSTRPRGARLPALYRQLRLSLFQSTRPRGARPSNLLIYSSCKSFNPRAHAGRDATPAICRLYKQVSIHAPTRGATISLFDVSTAEDVSIHAPTRGATNLHVEFLRDSELVSIHAPTRGATKSSRPDYIILASFNPRAHAGRAAQAYLAFRFQSTPRGARTNQQVQFQSTRPRGATILGATARPSEVSIHAPTRGATIMG